MVKIQPTSLYDQCVKILNEKVWNFTKEHGESCKLCSSYKKKICSVIQPVKEMFSLIPQNIIESIYVKVYEEFKSYCLFKRNRKSKTYVLYLALSLLGVEHTSINIEEFQCTLRSDISFVLKFGNNISKISFHHRNMRFRSRNISLWRTTLQNLKSIQVLDLSLVEFTDEFLELIGQECDQLKILKGIDYFNYRPITSVEESEYCITSKSFMRIFYSSKSNGKIANKCCESLNGIILSVGHNCKSERGKELYLKLNEIISVIIQNVPNIKTLGDMFELDIFLQSLGKISETRLNLEVIRIYNLTDKLVSMLKISCPKVRKLRCTDFSTTALQELHSFQFLEKLTVENYYGSKTLLYSQIVSSEWSTLKRLRGLNITGEVNIDVLIKQLPMIVELELQLSGEIKWSRTTYFEHLEHVTFRLANCNVSWFLSFINTIKHIKVSCSSEDTFDRNTCKLFLDVPFPCLKYLSVQPFSYDFLFNTSVLMSLPNLQCCSLLSSDYKLAIAEEIELSQFLKANNMYCALADYF